VRPEEGPAVGTDPTKSIRAPGNGLNASRSTGDRRPAKTRGRVMGFIRSRPGCGDHPLAAAACNAPSGRSEQAPGRGLDRVPPPAGGRSHLAALRRTDGSP